MKMDIFYVSGLCSDKKFKAIFNMSDMKPAQQIQKYHNLLLKGIKSLTDNIYIMTALPISRSNTKKKWFSIDKEIEGNALYHYLPFVNLPVLRHILIFFVGFFTCMNWSIKKRKKEKTIVCDVLNLTISIVALLASKLCGVKSVAIVTDIPNHLDNYTMKENSSAKYLFSNLYRLTCNFFMYRCDSYILLTEQMNELVNPKNKPHIAIEGMVDANMKAVSNTLENKYKEKVAIYAGVLRKNNGIKKLIEAFIKLDMDDARLWLFGSGEMEEEIRNYEKIDNKIKYFGVVPNQVVVEEGLKATLLVNPRPSIEEFTKYSFPSKNMEYMVSGTPILKTSLLGMPKEYYDYVYIIEDETVEGLTNILKVVMSKTREELHQKGREAKQFVLENKNNVVQAGRIVNVIDCMI